jgi:hypothetical protein
MLASFELGAAAAAAVGADSEYATYSEYQSPRVRNDVQWPQTPYQSHLAGELPAAAPFLEDIADRQGRAFDMLQSTSGTEMAIAIGWVVVRGLAGVRNTSSLTPHVWINIRGNRGSSLADKGVVDAAASRFWQTQVVARSHDNMFRDGLIYQTHWEFPTLADCRAFLNEAKSDSVKPNSGLVIPRNELLKFATERYEQYREHWSPETEQPNGSVRLPWDVESVNQCSVTSLAFALDLQEQFGLKLPALKTVIAAGRVAMLGRFSWINQNDYCHKDHVWLVVQGDGLDQTLVLDLTADQLGMKRVVLESCAELARLWCIHHPYMLFSTPEEFEDRGAASRLGERVRLLRARS